MTIVRRLYNLCRTVYQNLLLRMEPEQKPKPEIWYVQLMKYNGPDQPATLDTKRSQLFTSRESLLADMRQKIGTEIECLTPHDPANPPDEALYRWYDTEEWVGTWQLFWIKRYSDAYDE